MYKIYKLIIYKNKYSDIDYVPSNNISGCFLLKTIDLANNPLLDSSTELVIRYINSLHEFI